MKILILTRYDSLGASSRYRFYQYIPFLRQQGYEITIQPLLTSNYINYLYHGKSLPFVEIITRYFKRVFLLLRKNNYQLIWLQQEAFPWIPSWFEKILVKSNIPLIVDYDDASFHRYDRHENSFVKFLLKNKIDDVMSYADVVLAGNRYLSDRAYVNKCKSVTILPTVVDTDRYIYDFKPHSKLFTIGWIGSPPTAKYLYEIRSALKESYNEGGVKFVFIGTGELIMEGISFEIMEWSEANEVNDIQGFDVGIMPLINSDWEKGKCGFKLIQYMACAKPVIGSPIGINSEIINNGVNGFQANSNEEWIKYLRILKGNPNLRKEMGLNGRKLVEEKYSLHVNAPKLIQVFNNVLQS